MWFICGLVYAKQLQKTETGKSSDKLVYGEVTWQQLVKLTPMVDQRWLVCCPRHTRDCVCSEFCCKMEAL